MLTEGAHELGTLIVAVVDFVPILVDPLYVTHDTVNVAEFDVGQASAQEVGTVNVVFAPMLVCEDEWEPIEYVIVWVNESLARFVLTVTVPPKSTLLHDGCDARAIVVSVAVPEPEVADKPVVPDT